MDEEVKQTEPEVSPTSDPNRSPEERISAIFAQAAEPDEQTEEIKAAETDESEPVDSAESTITDKAEDPETAEASDEDVVTVSSLAELLESVGQEADAMYDLTFPVTIGGERQDIPLSEIKDSFRATKEAQRFQEEAKAAREEAKTFAQTTQEQIKQQLAQAHSLSEGLDAMYLAPFQNVDWASLRAEDPAEYAAKRQEYIDTKNHVDAQKQKVVAEIEQFKSQAEAEQAQVMAELLAREQQALTEKWPEMADEEKGDAERSALVGFLKSDGFTEDEIGSVADHRILLLVRDAMRYREQAKQADVAKKKVIKIGKKVLKPGAAQTKAEQARSKIDPLRERLRKTGRVEDFAALLSSTRK